MLMGKELHKCDSEKANAKCWTAEDESQSCSMMLSKDTKKWKPLFPTSSLCVTFYPMNYAGKWIRVFSRVKNYSRKKKFTLFLLAASVPVGDAHPLPDPLLLLHNAHLAPSLGVMGLAVSWQEGSARRQLQLHWCSHSLSALLPWLKEMDKTSDVSGTDI